MVNVKFLKGTAAQYTALTTKDTGTFYYTTDDSKVYLGSIELTVPTSVLNAISDLQDDIEALTGGETGSISGLIEEKINAALGEDWVEGTSVYDAIDAVLQVANAANTAAGNAQNTANSKQDALSFNTTPSDTNKVATMSDVNSAVAGLSGAMHYRGSVDAVPTSIEGYAAGDVVTVGKIEYVCDGSSFRELGNEGDYVVAGSVKNDDIAADAAIAMSKIDGLSDALSGKADASTLGTMAAENASDYVKGTAVVTSYVTPEIQKLDYTTIPENKDYVKSITETDGVISPTYGVFDFDAKGSAASAQTAAQNYTDAALTWGSISE